MPKGYPIDINKLDKEHGEEIVYLYTQKFYPMNLLAEKFLGDSNNGKAIRKVLVRHEIEIDSYPSWCKNALNSHFDIGFFETWSQELAYILGFVAADGYLDRKGLHIGLQKGESEKLLLERFREILKSDTEIKERITKIRDKSYEQYHLDIWSKNITKEFAKYNIFSSKTFCLGRFDFIPQEYEISFIRGFFDGDGCVYRAKPKKEINKNRTVPGIIVTFGCADKTTLEYLVEILNKYGLIKVNIHEKDLNSGNKFYNISYSTINSLKFFNIIYKDASLFLQRKYDKFIEIINERELLIQSKKENKRS